MRQFLSPMVGEWAVTRDSSQQRFCGQRGDGRVTQWGLYVLEAECGEDIFLALCVWQEVLRPAYILGSAASALRSAA